jgi:hypothetical protein
MRRKRFVKNFRLGLPLTFLFLLCLSSPASSLGQDYRPFAVEAPSRANEPPSPLNNVPQRRRFHIERHPMSGFREELKKTALDELTPAFPELRTVINDPEENSSEPPYQRVVFQLLDTAKEAPADQRPAILFAADLVASHLNCEKDEAKEALDCARLQSGLARYDLTLKEDHLGGVFYYPRDLLWRIWRDYPTTSWGERAFVLLLDHGWDTSATCEKGQNQTHEVIRQGESFLRNRPGSPYRAVVTLLVAEAYASWWSLSNEPKGSDMSSYVDPKQFQEGAEAARLKAIHYFEQLPQLVPGTKFSEFAQQVLAPLREQQALDNYRFFCVYD